MCCHIRTILLLSSLSFTSELFAASSTNLQERGQQFQEPENSGELIDYDWTGGNWLYQTVQGNFRFVITAAPESEAKKLYIQWWRLSEGKEKEISYSLSPKELNSAPVYKFNKVECLNAACDKLKLKATHVFEEYEQDIVIELTGLGRYKISW